MLVVDGDALWRRIKVFFVEGADNQLPIIFKVQIRLQPYLRLDLRQDIGVVAGRAVYELPELHVIMIAAGILSLLALLLFLLFGRDPVLVRTVEFYPPDGITSAEAGYIIDATVDKKDVVSLILYWASKGYLTIDQTKGILLKKVKDLPDKSEEYERYMSVQPNSIQNIGIRSRFTSAKGAIINRSLAIFFTYGTRKYRETPIISSIAKETRSCLRSRFRSTSAVSKGFPSCSPSPLLNVIFALPSFLGLGTIFFIAQFQIHIHTGQNHLFFPQRFPLRV